MHRIVIIVFAAALAAPFAHASACTDSSQPKTGPRWVLDHYVYDASLRQDWEVLTDCNHPAAPAQMKLAPATAHAFVAKRDNPSSAIAIHAGAPVEVSSPANASASIRLLGTAMQTAFVGQPIRIRLNSSGRFVSGLVRGPHSVELAAAKPLWGQP